MSKVTGKVKHNRPYFFTNIDGSRAEFPAESEGSADLEGSELAKFEALVKVGAIELTKTKQADEPELESDLREEYKKLTGKKADGRWSDERIEEEIEKLKAE